MSGRHLFEELTKEFSRQRRVRVEARKEALLEAMGGQLTILAEFPQGSVVITNFSDAGEDTPFGDIRSAEATRR